MRTFIFLFCATVFSLTPNDIVSQNSKIIIQDDRTLTVDEVFRLISDQTDYNFFYESGIFKDFPKIKVKKGVVRTNKLLRKSLFNNDFEITITNDYDILIKKRELSSNNEIQDFEVSGTIKDKSGQPLPGANILEKGTTNGTQTDFDGNFSLTVSSENIMLVVSYLGYKTKEVVVNKETNLSIVLQEDTSSLDEIVVVAYGVQKKENLTAAVSTVNLDNLDSKPITNISQAFAGMAAGITAVQSSSQPGSSGATIRVRGQNTLGGVNNTPLVIIDGAVGGSLNDINPSDIASISILKDASSTAMYGARAAAGVILITTKRGTVGKMSVSYDYFAGWDEATELPDVISNSADYMELLREKTGDNFPTDALIQEFRDDAGANPFLYPNTDWYETILGGQAFMQSHRLSVRGGSEQARVAASINYLVQDGLIENTGNDRIGLRLNFDSKISDKFNIGANLFANYSKRESPGGNIQNVLSYMLSTVPYIVPKNEEGLFGFDGYAGSGGSNPVAQINSLYTERETNTFIGTVFGSYNILPNLKLTSSATVNNDQITTSSITKKYLRYHFLDGRIDSATNQINTFAQAGWRNRIITLNTTLNYNFDINDKHFVSVLGGYSQEEDRLDTYDASGAGLVDESLFVLDSPQDQSSYQIGGNKTFNNLRSYFGRLNYSFDEKYLLEASFRYDGSSKFREDLRWGFFPSISLGWNIHKEAFMENANFISFLKLRSSAGKVGNNQSLGRYSSISTLNFGANYPFNGEDIDTGVFLSELANPQLIWEETTTYGIGLDFRLFNNKLTGEIDLFTSRTDGILRRIQAPFFGGIITAPFENLAVVDNRGYELTLTYRNNDHKLKYSVDLTMSHVKNKIVSFNDGQTQEINGNTINKEGYAINSIYVLESEGIFRTQEQIDNHATQPQAPQIGDLIYKDQLTVDTDGDGIFDEADGVINADDRKIFDPAVPKVNLGLNLNLEYKGFDFNMLLQGAFGNKNLLRGAPSVPFAFPGGRGVTGKEWLNAYHETRNPDPNTNYPRLDATSGNFVASDYWIKDFSFLRFKTLQLGYTLPESVISNIGLSRARLYVNGQNMFTIENVPHFDPESVGRVYPLTRTMTIGVQLTF